MNDKPNENLSSHQKVPYRDGTQNYILTFFLIVIYATIIDNYLKYGIIYTPYQLVVFFLKFLNRTKWVYIIVLIGILLQLVTSILVEKLLLRGSLSERTGIIFHAFNSLLVFNIIAIISTCYKYSCSAGFTLTAMNFMFVIKFWSFACFNRRSRSKYLKDNSTIIAHRVEYPNNLTFSHLAKFVIGSPRVVYLPDEIKPTVLNIENVVIHLVGMSASTVAAAFCIYQYFLPESIKIVWLIESSNLLVALIHLSKLVVPTLATFFFIYYFAFVCYFPLLAAVMGVRLDVYLMDDWWNAKDLLQFWSMWNLQTSLFFKHHIMRPMLKRGYSHLQGLMASFLVSGLLHEYIFTVPMRSAYGQSVLTFLLQVPLGKLTKRIRNTFGDAAGNRASVIQVVIVITLGSFAVYYQYIRHEYGSIKNCEFSKLII